jgi:hypothetical protein
MTPQEQQMIDGLVDRIKSTQVTDKDTAAEQYLQQGLAGYPDAIYVLAQTVLVQQYGLSQAQQQIQALQAQLQQQQQQQPSGGGSFLSHLFGGSQQPSQPQYQPVNTGYPPPQYAPPVAYGQPVAYAQPASGGFMRSALQTAAGVAMGEMAFQSMEGLFHGFGGGGYGGGYGGGRPEEVVNNYYGDGNERHEGGGDSGFYNPDHDASRQDGSQFADSNNDDLAPTTDDMPADDTSYDDAGSDTYTGSDSGDDGGF